MRTFLAVVVISMVAGLIWYFRSPFDAETLPTSQISERSALELDPSEEAASSAAPSDEVAAAGDSAAAEEGADSAGSSATDSPVQPLPENYFDWQLAVGPVTSKLLDATSEPLIQLSDAQDVSYRLAKEITFAAKFSTIKLKDGIYWSDQTRLNAQQALDGFDRLKAALTEGNWNHTDSDLYRWLKQLTIKAVDLDTLQIVGLVDEVELRKLAASLALRPVRKDLLERFSDIRAWQVGIGAYVISDTGANGELVLEPNSLYFRGAPTEPLKITLTGK